MNKKTRKLITWCLVFTMVLTQMLFTNVAFAATKHEGNDRYATAAAIATSGWTTSDYAVLATGEDYPDALAAAPLAQAYGAPILLTEPKALNDEAKTALTSLKVKNVIIVGGEGAVSKEVADAVSNMSITVDRVAGADRVETALNIAKALEKKLGKAPEAAFLATSQNYADALAASPIAAAMGAPILLATDKDTVDPNVVSYIGNKQVYVLGGTGVISNDVAAKFTGSVRLGGVDRYATSLAINQKFTDLGKVKFDKVFVATGENYPDALAGSVLAAKSNSILVLVNKALDTDTANFLKAHAAGAKVETLGALKEVADAAAVIEGYTPAELKVESVSAINLAEVKVDFNAPVDKSSIDLGNFKYDGVKLDSNNKDSFTLSEDGRTVVFYKSGAFVTGQQQTRKISLSGIKAVGGKEMTPVVDQKITFVDTEVPTLKSVDVLGNRLLTLVFSEPLDKSLNSAKIYSNYRVDNKAVVGDATAPVSISKNKVTLTLAAGLSAGEHTMNFVNGTVKDYAGFGAVAPNVKFTVLEDTAKPEIKEVVAAEQNMLELQFNKAVNVSNAKIYWMSGVVKKQASVYTLSDKSYVYADFYDLTHTKALPLVETTVYIEGVKDYYGNAMDKVELKVKANADITRPTVKSVVPELYNENGAFIATFDEDVLIPTSWYNKVVVTNKDGNKVTVSGLQYNTDTSGEDIKSEVKILGSFPSSSSPYTVTIKDFPDLSPQENTNLVQEFKIGVDDTTKPSVQKVTFIPANKSLVITFSKAVDPATAADLSNYTYEYNGLYIAFPSGADVVMSNNLKVATITLPTYWYVGSTKLTAATYFNTGIRMIINNITDLLGNKMGTATIVIDNDMGSLAKVDSVQSRSKNTIRIQLNATGNLPVEAYAGDFQIVLASDGTTPVSGLYVTDAKVDSANRRINLTLSDEINADGKSYGTPAIDFKVKTIDDPSITQDAYGIPFVMAATVPTDKVSADLVVPTSGALAVTGNTVVVTFNEPLALINVNDKAGSAFVVRDRDGEKLTLDEDYTVETSGSNVLIKFAASQDSYVTVELKDNTLVKDVAGNLVNDFDAVQSYGPVVVTPAAPTFTINYATEKTNEVIPATVEYATDAAFTTPTDGAGAAITVTPGTNLYFRVKATATAPAGAVQTLTVPARPVAIAEPVVGKFPVAATSVKLSGLPVSASNLEAVVAIDGITYETTYTDLTVDASGNAEITGLTGVTASTTVKIRVKATASSFYGLDKVVTVTAE